MDQVLSKLIQSSLENSRAAPRVVKENVEANRFISKQDRSIAPLIIESITGSYYCRRDINKAISLIGCLDSYRDFMSNHKLVCFNQYLKNFKFNQYLNLSNPKLDAMIANYKGECRFEQAIVRDALFKISHLERYEIYDFIREMIKPQERNLKYQIETIIQI